MWWWSDKANFKRIIFVNILVTVILVTRKLLFQVWTINLPILVTKSEPNRCFDHHLPLERLKHESPYMLEDIIMKKGVRMRADLFSLGAFIIIMSVFGKTNIETTHEI